MSDFWTIKHTNETTVRSKYPLVLLHKSWIALLNFLSSFLQFSMKWLVSYVEARHTCLQFMSVWIQTHHQSHIVKQSWGLINLFLSCMMTKITDTVARQSFFISKVWLFECRSLFFSSLKTMQCLWSTTAIMNIALGLYYLLLFYGRELALMKLSHTWIFRQSIADLGHEISIYLVSISSYSCCVLHAAHLYGRLSQHCWDLHSEDSTIRTASLHSEHLLGYLMPFQYHFYHEFRFSAAPYRCCTFE